MDAELKEGADYETRHSLQIGACVGAILFGVSIPVAIVVLAGDRAGFSIHGSRGEFRPWEDIVAGWIFLQIVATIFCGPGAVILAIMLMSHCRSILENGGSLRRVQVSGVIGGALLAFANFPAYAAIIYFEEQPHATLKLITLFLVAGATSGAIISWQAWREVNPNEGYWPRYSLRALLIAVFAWGALLALFVPR
jgi:hypothetical protein